MSTSTGPEAARGIIGKVATLTLEQARGIAEGMSHRVKAGGDPLEDKQAARDALTVARLLDSYTASPRYAEKGPATQRTGIGQINRHLKPPLGKRHVARLEQDDIRRAFAADRDGDSHTLAFDH